MDRKFTITNNIGLFAPIITPNHANADEILHLVRTNIAELASGWVRNGVTNRLSITLSQASDSHVSQIEQKLHNLELQLYLKESNVDEIVYEINKEQN